MRVRDWKLVHEDNGREVMMGDTLTDFRGEKEKLMSGEPPHKPGSTGRVYTRSGGFFPSVFGLEWVRCAPEKGD